MTRRTALVSTQQLQELLAAGKKVYLPTVTSPGYEVEKYYDTDDKRHLFAVRDASEKNRIVDVEHSRADAVRCISIDHPRHLYLTDGFTPTHNTSNIVFLKSTDDTMLDMLSKLSGTRHVTYRDSKTVTRDVKDMINQVEGKVSYTMAVKEEPVISFNDLVFLPPRNAVVFRAGDPPVWNRNETILPMSWRLFKDTITLPGKKPTSEFSLQTIPTLSTAADFDVRFNQPDFVKMFNKRLRQAVKAERAEQIYSEAFGYDERAMMMLDPDVKSRELMEVISTILRTEAMTEQDSAQQLAERARMDEEVDEMGVSPDDFGPPPGVPTAMFQNPDEALDASLERDSRKMESESTNNDDVAKMTDLHRKIYDEASKKRFAGKQISRDMLVEVLHDAEITDDETKEYDIKDLIKTAPGLSNLDPYIASAYDACLRDFERDGETYRVGDDGTLYDAATNKVFIEVKSMDNDVATLNADAKDGNKRVFMEDEDAADEMQSKAESRYQPTEHFKRHLALMRNWNGIIDGRFEEEMKREWDRRDVTANA